MHSNPISLSYSLPSIVNSEQRSELPAIMLTDGGQENWVSGPLLVSISCRLAFQLMFFHIFLCLFQIFLFLCLVLILPKAFSVLQQQGYALICVEISL